jgi:O-antigen/teichoic acid export membrane protein
MFDSFVDSNQTRIVRSLKTAGLGFAAKLLGLVNQIFSVALISSALGAEGLSEQMLAISFVSWFNLTLFGMHTALPLLLIRYGASRKVFASIGKTAFLIALIGAWSAAGLTLLILWLDWIPGLSSAPIATAAICSAAVVTLNLSEKIFQALDRIATFNVLNMAGTAISLALTFFFARTHGTAAEFVVAYYLSTFLPFLIAALMVVSRLDLTTVPTTGELRANAHQLFGFGVFGYGNEIASYCKLHAPLALLSALKLSSEIAPVGLALRLTGLVSGALWIVIPIFFVRIGTAVNLHNLDAARLWIRLGIACAGAVALLAAGSFLLFGPEIYQAWTGGTVTLGYPDQVALAAFAALSLAQNLLFTLVAADPSLADRVRWLFWIEGPAILLAGTFAALIVPAAHGAAAMLGGAVLVMIITSLVMLILLLRKPFAPQIWELNTRSEKSSTYSDLRP